MPYPVILVNSVTGSDSAASGAGPSTALTGNSASTDATGLVVTLDGSPDLTNVATDGSHVLFLNDSTAGARNFGSIVGKDDSAKTVTITSGEAFRVSASNLSWAIGGQRATLDSAITRKLFSNNSGAGDGMGGWTIRLQSDQTITSTIVIRRQNMPRPFTITSDSTTRKVIQTGAASSGFRVGGNGVIRVVFDNLHVQNTRSSSFDKINTVGIGDEGNYGNESSFTVRNCIVGGSSGTGFHTGISAGYNGLVVENCNVTYNGLAEYNYGGGIAISDQSNSKGYVANNFVANNLGVGIVCGQSWQNTPATVLNNIVAFNSSDGIFYTGTASGQTYRPIISNNTIHGNGRDGIRFAASSTAVGYFFRKLCNNNSITAKSGYGINFTGSNITADFLEINFASYDFNNFGTGASSNSLGAWGGVTPQTSAVFFLNPEYADAANGNFAIGTALKGRGYPNTNIGRALARSYIDIGAIQSQMSNIPFIGAGGLVY